MALSCTGHPLMHGLVARQSVTSGWRALSTEAVNAAPAASTVGGKGREAKPTPRRPGLNKRKYLNDPLAGKLVKPGRVPSELLDPDVEGADPVICLQNAVQVPDSWAAYRSLKACVEHDVKLAESIEKGSSASFHLERLTPENVSSAFMLALRNKKRFARAETTSEIEVQNLLNGFDVVFDGGKRNPSLHTRAYCFLPTVKNLSGRFLEGNRLGVDVYKKAVDLKANDADKAYALTTIIRGLQNGGSVQHAADLTSRMIEKLGTAPKDRTLKLLFQNLGYVGKVDTAVALLLKIRDAGIPLTATMLGGIVYAYAHLRKISSAAKYFYDVKDLDLPLNSDPYGGMIRAHALRLQAADALQEFRLMRSDKLPATPAMFADLIRVHGAVGDLTNAVHFYYKNEMVKDFRPDVEMLGALIDAYAFNGEITTAWRHVLEGAQQFSLLEILEGQTFRGLAAVHTSLDAANLIQTFDSAGISATLRPVFAVSLARNMVPNFNHTLVDAGKLKDAPIYPAGTGKPDSKAAAKRALEIIELVTGKNGPFNPESEALAGKKQFPSPHITLARAYDAAMAAHLELGAPEKVAEIFQTVEKLRLPVIKRSFFHLLQAGSQLKNHSVVDKALRMMNKKGHEINGRAVELLLKSAGFSINKDGKLVGKDSAETGYGPAATIVERFIAEGGFPMDGVQPILSAYIKDRGLNLLLDDL
ncbi:hypothetical protein HDU96_008707 [Phlyctochytrium bullatum]|nr:hypothetical protein HDU96_008707 [Phlyctochytrium bullatum]